MRNIIRLWKFKFYTKLANSCNIIFSCDNKDTIVENTNNIDISILKTINSEYITFSNKISKTMCQMMKLAYETPELIHSRIGDSCIIFQHQPCTILKIKNSNRIIILFAGTREQCLKDWWINITASHLLEWESIKGNVYQYLKALNIDDPIIFVGGHSKGGITAVLAYNDFLKNNVKVHSCFIAGTPDYFIDKQAVSEKTIGIFNIKKMQDPISGVFGSNPSNWEVLIGKDEKYLIEQHSIDSYIDFFDN